MRTFLTGLDEDIRKDLMIQLRNLWTHASTAIEGNVLTLGETAFVLGEGLTVAGKPLKDHEEVVGHARAIDLLSTLVNRTSPVRETDLFDLHRVVQTSVVVDIFRPVGAWKIEPNGVWARDRDGGPVFREFSDPEDVPALMHAWLTLLNELAGRRLSESAALDAYVQLHAAFVRIHPFFDGNGRMARLLANLPVLRSGHPPILIPVERRSEYTRLLGDIDGRMGKAAKGTPLIPPPPDLLAGFQEFCREAWSLSKDLVAAAWERQKARNAERLER